MSQRRKAVSKQVKGSPHPNAPKKWHPEKTILEGWRVRRFPDNRHAAKCLLPQVASAAYRPVCQTGPESGLCAGRRLQAQQASPAAQGLSKMADWRPVAGCTLPVLRATTEWTAAHSAPASDPRQLRRQAVCCPGNLGDIIWDVDGAANFGRADACEKQWAVQGGAATRQL